LQENYESNSKIPERVPLHPIEKTLLGFLSKEKNKGNDWVDLNSISSGSGLSLDQVRRAIGWLVSKNMLETQEEERIFYSLGSEGKRGVSEGLPERRLVRMLEASGGKMDLQTLTKKMGSEFSVALGMARKNDWVKLFDGTVGLNDSKWKEKEKEECLLEKIQKIERVSAAEFSSQEIDVLHSLQKRHKGLIVELAQKKVRLRVTARGIEASGLIREDQEIDEITPAVIQSQIWRSRSLRPIDVTSSAPNFYGGRKHPIRAFIDEVKEAFVSLGFEEIDGPIIQSALWNFDSLFIPQQHSTREMQDTFYLSNIRADISKFAKEIRSIKKSHEKGGGTGSLGWRYNWSEEEARRVVLRTHTTAVTIKYLSDHKPKESRVFLVGKVFRNEKPNYKHNPEFYQIEGVMVGPHLNVRNLIYVISEFYSKLGFKKIKFWPTYFPYTEPSLQTMVYYEKKGKWMELGGMGVFRPEVTIPLGVKNPVLAWGLGLDRLVMMRYDLMDIRDLFGANLGWLRKAKVL
jgi:phenylalanyl-tRNA synthetase alpha chain